MFLYNRYRKQVINMPLKIGGGNHMQEYDPSSGRYSCGTELCSSAYKKSQLLLDSRLIGAKESTSKIMPNYKNCVTPDEKFLNYSLDETSSTGKHKAIVYKKVLGFAKNNYSLLKNQIHNAISKGSAKLVGISKNCYGVIKYEYIISVIGANGNVANVVAVYGIGEKSTKPVMITNYVK